MVHSPGDTKALREAMGAFATGVTIVTAIADDGQPVGFTANSFTSVSLDPPLLLVCLAHKAFSYNIFCTTDSFAVNVLGTDQEDIATRFATKGIDKFADTEWTPGQMGAPLIARSLARFDCSTHQRVVAGDHDIIMGEVVGFSRHAGEALVYHSGSFRRLE